MNQEGPGGGPASGSPAGGRRRAVRLAAPPELRCALRGAPAVLTMSNISSGGFAARVNMPLGRNTVYEFEFTFGELRVVHRARVVHCAWVDGAQWNVGAEFLPAAAEPTVEQLIDRITGSALDFE